MKKIRLMTAYAVAFICVLTTLFLPKRQMEVFKTTTSDMEDKMMIYMMNESDQLVPVTMNVQKSASDEENIQQLFQLMKQEIGVYELRALLPVSIQCTDIEIENDLVRLNFNEAFFTMNSHIELRVIEAIVSSVVQFNDDYRVEFSVNQQSVREMPLSLLPMHTFDRTLGVNNFKLDSLQLHQSVARQIVELYEDETSSYFMVMTQRYPSDMSDLEFVNDVLHQTSLKLQCNRIEIADDQVFLYLNEAFLIEENLVAADRIMPLLYSLKMNQLGSRFTLFVNDEQVSIEGYDQKTAAFDDLNLNTFEE